MTDRDDDDDLAGSEDHAKIVEEAKRRFSFAEGYEGYARNLWEADYEFGHADSDNMAQWPDQQLTAREINQKPTLTVNKVRVHCLQIINDAKQNKAGIVVHPTTTDATYEAAEVFEDVVRHIEYASRAQQAYDHATEGMVYGGIGYCRIVSEYVDPESFDQDLLIKAIKDPMSVYLDPDAKETDKSDMEWAFVFDDMSREKFKRLYPDYAETVMVAPGGMYDSWISADHVRVAEYWRRNHKMVKMVSFLDPQTGQRIVTERGKVDPELLKAIRKEPAFDFRQRDSDRVTVECFKIAGSEVIDQYEWLGRWIPIVPAIAEEVVVRGQMDRKGHVRYLKDPQRIYNYNTSAAVEYGALQTKVPFQGPLEAFEGLEGYYAAANLTNTGYLPYKHVDSMGRTLEMPKRVDPPQAATVYMQGMETAQMEMMMASGQYQSQFGQAENATSGKAINERQRQGDNATYHFVDGAATMIRQLGRILVDLIPKYYDTMRILRIRGDDGSVKNVQIDPRAPQAVQKIETQDREQVSLIFNPNIGRYGVEADVGPSFATRRQEAWNAFIQIVTQSPNLIPIIGDLMFQNADFPGADQIAQRLRRMAPPAALGEGPSPQEEQLSAQMQQLQAMIQDLNAKLADKSAEVNIRAFEAETKRLQAIGNAGPIVTPLQAQPLIGQVTQEMLQGGMPQTFGQPVQGQPPQMPQMPPQGLPQ